MYRFQVKILYAGKLRIFNVPIEGNGDALAIIEEAQEILGVETLTATQIVSIERIADGA